jgi:hypothetical protein
MDILNGSNNQPKSGLDTVIKLLTILKLIIQTTLWGLALWFTIWCYYNNPLPKLIDDFTASIIKAQAGTVSSGSQLLQDQLKNLNIPGLNH